MDASQHVVLAEGQGIAVKRGPEGPNAKLRTKCESANRGWPCRRVTWHETGKPMAGKATEVVTVGSGWKPVR